MVDQEGPAEEVVERLHSRGVEEAQPRPCAEVAEHVHDPPRPGGQVDGAQDCRDPGDVQRQTVRPEVGGGGVADVADSLLDDGDDQDAAADDVCVLAHPMPPGRQIGRASCRERV